MAKMFSDKARPVLEFLQAHADEDLTAADIVVGMGMAQENDELGIKKAKKSIDAIVTSSFQKNGLTVRVPAQVAVEDEEGKTKYKDVKFIRLTDKGIAADPDAEKEEN